ncbi:MATE family efflux transporter [Thermobaculum terrenum]|nr:MATE family efflux transporter [Thermobaculum terrenum]
MLSFLLPLILGNALQSVGQLAGSIVLGRWIGVGALAAVANFFPVFFLMNSFVIGVGSGASILIGQAWGARNYERMRAVMGTTLAFVCLLGTGLAIVSNLLVWDLMRLLGTPQTIIADSVSYARIIFSCLPLLFLYFAYTTFIRGTGDSRTPTLFLGVSTGVNLLLLPVLVFGWGPAPRLGMFGAAWATVLGSTASLVAMLVYLRLRQHPLQLDSLVIRHLWIDPRLLGLLLKLGIPSSVNLILVSLSELAVISLVNRYGASATAAYGAVNQVVSYVQFPAVSLGITVSIFGAQAIGAGKLERLRRVLRSGVGLNYLVGGMLVVGVYLFAREILGLFLTDGRTLEIARELLYITLWGYLVFGHAQVFAALMRASGVVLWPTTFGIVAIWGVEVPVAYVLSTYTGLGLRGIWLGYPAAFLANLGMQYLYYRYVWRHKQITRLI